MNERVENGLSDFDLDDAPRLGRSIKIDNDKIKILIENNSRYATRVITEILKISQAIASTLLNILD